MLKNMHRLSWFISGNIEAIHCSIMRRGLKTRVFVAPHSEEFVILLCTFLIGLQGVTDTRRTPLQ